MSTTIAPTETDTVTYDFAADRADEVHTRIAAANRRLERAGITERFAVTIDAYIRRSKDAKTGLETATERIKVELNTPSLSLAGYTFIATLVQEEAGMIVRTAPGQNLDGWTRPDAHWCDYCNTRRTRTNSYVVREDATGAISQIGKSCLAVFLGISPVGLWTLDWNLDDMTAEDAEHTGSGYLPELYSVRSLIALAWVVSEQGRRFVTRGQARDFEDKVATADTTTDVWNHKPTGRDRDMDAYCAEKLAEANAVTDEQIDAILAEGATLGYGDYADNIRILLAGEFVSGRSVGTLVSLIAVHYRNSADRVQRAARPAIAKGYLGVEGEKLSGLQGTATVVKEIDGYYGITTMIVLQVESGHLIKWMASGTKDVEQGHRYRIARATIKKLDHWEGNDQTVITRAKLEPIAE